ncbi:glycoside hydrolase domain-containing protein [Nocardioides panaciterrulae]|uniref:DUF1906 domain-containing protein n=1 Tax=Nocardioides panaciterrulae TaxID=661492 RepID=A0A7Y9E336_9ACTN|nr:glycoside hydrolase domain-containing protein [Nocardioides panaciterrulae]NYD40348.1 hypothetical protein [Nocardioides panaciterrulae]
MFRPARRTGRPTVLSLATGLLATLATAALITTSAPGASARAANPVTPGDFTGYGFDQCQAPSQQTMNRWRRHSPFWAVGIYISGDSRACRDQTNLSPAWVGTQLARGWRLLPITLGPQASCQPRFPRYGDDETIDPRLGRHKNYLPARRQGKAEATKTVAAAQALGIVPGSTMYYDLEGFDLGNTACRESALAFLTAWTNQIHALDYVSGVYSSAGSGIKMLDDARVQRPGQFALPDQIWIARWDGRADTSTSYIRADGWMPHARVKQYQGGHDETWGRARVNIDRDFLDVGRGSVAPRESHCPKTVVNHRDYPKLHPANDHYTPAPMLVKTLQCLLQEHDAYTGKVTGRYDADTVAAAHAWQSAHGLAAGRAWNRRSWMTLLADGGRPLLKFGSASSDVRRLQRTLDAASRGTQLRVSGVFDAATQSALRVYQDGVGLPIDGIAAGPTWSALQAARR